MVFAMAGLLAFSMAVDLAAVMVGLMAVKRGEMMVV